MNMGGVGRGEEFAVIFRYSSDGGGVGISRGGEGEGAGDCFCDGISWEGSGMIAWTFI